MHTTRHIFPVSIIVIRRFVILGLKNPYMVLIDQNLASIVVQSQTLGFDAVSSYGINGGGTVEVNIC